MEKINIITNLNDKGKRLDKFLSEIIEDATRSFVQKLINNNLVLINSKIITKAGTKLKGNESIEVNILEENQEILPEDIPINKIYEDNDIIIINKNPDMVVHPAHGNYTGTLVNALLYHEKNLSDINGEIRPGIVHRLDKDTSGVIIVAKNNLAHENLVNIFKNKDISKTYLCIVKGILKNKSGRIENLIGRDPNNRKRMTVVENNGKLAISNYKVLKENHNKNYSLVEVNIETGRTHQIRVHMKSLNHPILGDATYGNINSLANRQMLHAFKLEFIHPISKKEMKIIAPIPKDMENVLKKLDLEIEVK